MAQSPDVRLVRESKFRPLLDQHLPAAAEAAKIGGSGSGIEEVSGTVTLDATGPAVREFWSTGATTFKANGVDTLISSATGVVWRRTGSGSWGYQTVPETWTTPAVTPDTKAPVAGTLAVTVTDVKADLSVSGASDDRGYVQYSFSKDNGATWAGYQDSASYSFTGLTASTAYTFRHRVKDAAGNVTTGAVVSKTTAATPTPAPTPDTTAPVAGTLTVATTDVKADLTVSGASDDKGAVTYAFSKDNGATWTAYQSGATYSFTGLTGSTSYTFKHKVKDSAGNETVGTAVSKTTAATPPTATPPNPYETVALSMGVQYFARLDEGSGATAPNRGTAGGSISILSSPSWGTPGVTGYDKAQTGGMVAFSNHIPTGTTAYTAAVALRVSKLGIVISDWSSKNRVQASTTGPWTLTGPTATPVTGGNAAVVGNVYHVAITWDGAVSKLYVDGAQVASVADPGPVTQSPFMTFQTGAGPINGLVYDTSRALTAAQIKQLSDAVTR